MRVVDLDTGLPVRKVLWVETEPVPPLGPGVMLLEALRVDQHGNTVVNRQTGTEERYVAKGRFKLEMVEPAPPKQSAMGAPKCAKCQSTMTLPGDDLCFACRAEDKCRAVQKVDDPFADHKCAVCSRKADWSVSDEVDVTPALSGFTVVERRMRGRKVQVVVPGGEGKQRWARAATVGRRYYCSRHYQPPRLLDSTGEPIRDFDTSNRPS